MTFRVIALEAEAFAPFFAMEPEELARHGGERIQAGPLYPCRVGLEDSRGGEEALLINYEHQPAATPFRSRHAIFVLAGSRTAQPQPGVVPRCMASRPLSVRSFDAEHRMIDADLAIGVPAEALFERLLADPRAAYLQAHYARRGCFAARVERA
jgi:hypothetical protein